MISNTYKINVLSIMQPYFFPYFGYFKLISQSDKFIIFDTVQYTTRTWMNRNRILKPYVKHFKHSKDTQNNVISKKELHWQYITLDLQNAPQQTKMHDILLCDKKKSNEKILAQLKHYKKYAPYYSNVMSIIDTCFKTTQTDYLVDLNVQSLKTVCSYLEIDFNPFIFSQEKVDLPKIEYSGQWALEISTYYKAKKYLNPPAGKGIFMEEEFKKRGIELCFMDMPNLIYSCTPYTFENNLSILDVLMWNSKEDVQECLRL